MKFQRWGGLSPKKQHGYGLANTFHAPPAKRGIYAFIWPHMSAWLLSGTEGFPGKDKSELPYRNGKLVRPRLFDYSGFVWHHFTTLVPPTEILDQRGTWVLTTTLALSKALKKAFAQTGDEYDIHPSKYRFHGRWEEHFEVFIEGGA